MQRWCPNCHFFYKDMGMNYCHLADGSEGYEPSGYDQQALDWLKQNQQPNSAINRDANDCPRFIPSPLVAQQHWFEQNQSAGSVMTKGQHYWLNRRHGAR